MDETRYQKTCEAYRQAVLKRWEKIDFLGIPHLKDKKQEALENIYVPLRLRVCEPVYTRFDETKPLNAWDQLESDIPRQTDDIFDQVLSSPYHSVILGDPGSGKSTLLQFLTLTLANKQFPDKIPMLILLRKWAKECEKEQLELLPYFYREMHHELRIELFPGFLEEALRRGQGVLLIDGWDEVPHRSMQEQLRNYFIQLQEQYSQSKMIVTSRIVGYHNVSLDPHEFRHWQVQEFRHENIATFIKNWYMVKIPDHKKEREERIASLKDAVNHSGHIFRLAQNPLILTIIALVHRVEAVLPHQRIVLYDKCSEALLTTWEQYKKINRDHLTETKKRQRLETLAYHMHCKKEDKDENKNNSAVISESELKQHLAQLLEREFDEENIAPEIEQFLAYIKERAGILLEKGAGTYSFIHLTFQEYFCACYLRNRFITNLDALWKQIQPRLLDERWHEVIRLMLSKMNEIEEAVDTILNRMLEEYDTKKERQILFLMGNSLADKLESTRATKRKIIEKLLFEYIANPDFFYLLHDLIEANDNHRGILAKKCMEIAVTATKQQVILLLELFYDLRLPEENIQNFYTKLLMRINDLEIQELLYIFLFQYEQKEKELILRYCSLDFIVNIRWRMCIQYQSYPTLLQINSLLFYNSNPQIQEVSTQEITVNYIFLLTRTLFFKNASQIGSSLGRTNITLVHLNTNDLYQLQPVNSSAINKKIDILWQEILPDKERIYQNIAQHLKITVGDLEDFYYFFDMVLLFILRDLGGDLIRDLRRDLRRYFNIKKGFGVDFDENFVKYFATGFGKDFTKNFIKDFGKNTEKDFTKNFGRHFARNFEKDTEKDLNRYFERYLETAREKYSGADFGRSFIRDFARDFIRDFGRNLTRDPEKYFECISIIAFDFILFKKSTKLLFNEHFAILQKLEKDILEYNGDSKRKDFAVGNLLLLYTMFEIFDCAIEKKSQKNKVLAIYATNKSFPIRLAYLWHLALGEKIEKEQLLELKALMNTKEPEEQEIVALVAKFITIDESFYDVQ